MNDEKDRIKRPRKWAIWLSPRSLTGRLLLAAGLWAGAALLLGGYILSTAFRDYAADRFDERLYDALDSLVGVTEISSDGLVVFTRSLSDLRFEAPYSGWYWQISTPGQDPIRSRSLWDYELDVDFSHDDVVADMYQTLGPDGQRLRVIERDVMPMDSEITFRYLVAADTTSEIEQVALFNQLVSMVLGGLGLFLVIAIIMQITFGLYPLARIRNVLGRIRSGQQKRLQRSFPPEVLPLVDEVNAVLDHNDEVVRRARTHVGNLAHALKTPLAVIANEAALSKDKKFAALVSRQVSRLQRHVEHHLVRARVMGRARGSGVQTNVAEAVAAIVRSIKRIHSDEVLKIEQKIGNDIVFWGHREDLDEILGNLIDNAAKWCHGHIRISATNPLQGEFETFILIDIEDDGPGVSKENLRDIFERGARLDETKPGTGLGLSIVRDIAEMYGGRVVPGKSDLGGLKLCVILPTAPADVAAN